MATVLVVSTLLSPFSAVSTASAEDVGHLTPGIYKPTPIGIGTNINVSTSDPGVATYVGRDMYIGGKPSDTNTLDASNAPTGSYAAEAEGLTVVRGKLAMNPIKRSWGGEGFRFGTVGFGSQFRPDAGSTVLAVAGIESSIEKMNTGREGMTSETATVGAWTRGAWVGKSKENTGSDYTAKIAGPITYWNADNRRQSVVKKQGNYYEGKNAGESSLFNQVNFLNDINGKNYSNYSGDTGYLTMLSNQLNSFAKTGEVSYSVAPACNQDNRYIINKYDKTDCNYGLVFDGSYKTINEDCADTSLNGKQFKNSERLITFKGDNTSMQQVFTIDASELSNTYNNEYYRGVDFAFECIPDGASVVVNVTGSSNIEFHNGWRFWWNGTEISRYYETRYSGTAEGKAYATASQSIMWNFADTTSLTIRGGIAGEGREDWGGGDGKWTDDDPAAAMIGSVLVPKGSFDCHVTTNGRVYVGKDFSMNNPRKAWSFNPEGNSASVIDMDQERHNFPWSGSYTPDGSSIAWSKVDDADGTKLLPGSSWTIYGTVDDAKKGTNPIVTVTDGAANDYASTDGKLQFNYLNQKAKIGDPSYTNYFTYYIKEVAAPAGYQKSETIYYATMNNTGEKPNYVEGYVDGNDKKVPFENNATGAITNTKITGTVSWTKVEENDTKHTPLPGSEWALTRVEDANGVKIANAVSLTVIDNDTNKKAVSDKWADSDQDDGKFTLEGLLPGTYTLVETQAPIGYEKNSTAYEFKVSNTDGSITWTEGKSPTIDGSNVYISNALATTSVQIPVTKSVRNTDWPKDSSGYVAFKFSIEATGENKGNAPKPEPTTISVVPSGSTKLNDITATFGAKTFNKLHLSDTPGAAGDYAKTYTYTVKEVAPTTDAIDKLRYSKAEYQVAVTVKAAKDKTTGKYSGLTTSTTVTQVKDDMGNKVSSDIGTVDAPDPIPASTFTNVKVLTDLPLTGAGWTENSMLLVGAGLMLLGGIAAGAYWFATKRRQDDPSDGAGR